MGKLTTLQPRIATLNTARLPKRSDKVANSFYRSKQWREAREIAIGLAHGYCAMCPCRPRTPFVDHKVELQDGGAPYDQGNLQVLCGSCHTLKTAQQRAFRMLRT
jgi:5-methylcytosine-specific restriction enzyme A